MNLEKVWQIEFDFNTSQTKRHSGNLQLSHILLDGFLQNITFIAHLAISIQSLKLLLILHNQTSQKEKDSGYSFRSTTPIYSYVC